MLQFVIADAFALSNSYFGQGNEIGLESVMCNGTEERLIHCQALQYSDRCSLSESAGVKCAGESLKYIY